MEVEETREHIRLTLEELQQYIGYSPLVQDSIDKMERLDNLVVDLHEEKLKEAAKIVKDLDLLVTSRLSFFPKLAEYFDKVYDYIISKED
jgi:hypothetical protein